MRIAMVCPLDAVITPEATGTPHRAIAELAGALTAAGHQVTLFAAEESSGGSELVSWPVPAGGDRGLTPPLRQAFQMAGLLEALRNDPHDMVHNHAGPAAAVLLTRTEQPLLSTIHLPLAPGEDAGWRSLGTAACLAGESPGAAPDGVQLLGTVTPGAQMAQGYLGLYEQVLDRRENHRPWGHYIVLEDQPRHKVKRIVVNPGQRLSLQLHHRRAEHWMVIEGEGMVTVGDEEIRVPKGEAIDIPREARHRMRNAGDEPCVFIEVQTGDYFGEDDIVRLEDDYGRDG